MKKIIHRIQALGERAAQLRHVVEGAPAVATGIRDAVAVTAGQLQQLRADVQAGVSGLRVEDEDRLLAALREICGSASLLEQAGFGLGGVEVELGLLRRIVVRLERIKDISLAELRSMHASSAGQPTVQALLNALIKAEEMAARVRLPELTYRELVVDVGPAPTVRVCWRPDTVVVDAEPLPSATLPKPVTVPPVLTSAPSLLGKSSFFEPRTPVALAPGGPAGTSSVPEVATMSASSSPIVALPAASGSAAPPAATPSNSGVAAAGDWKRGALDRFKRMPDLTKPRH